MSYKIEYRDICLKFGKRNILENVNICAKEGELTGIVGPNGCGKSSLIKTTFGFYEYNKGDIFIEGISHKKYSNKELSQKIGYVAQENNVVFNFTVYDIVSMGNKDIKAVYNALDELKISHLVKEPIQNLSGGERKMVFIARALAQNSDIIILDEPTNHLDINHQLFILDYLKKSGKTILMVIHDLRLATKYCDSIYVIKDGKNFCSGKPEKALSKENVYNVFGINGEVLNIDKYGLDFMI